MIATWYGVIAFMLVTYVVLDGRNFGVGILQRFVATTPDERRQVIATIRARWSWHEVWLIAFGGTLVAVFPRLMASAFAGYYLALVLILWGLVLRGISLEVVDHIDDRQWQSFWDAVFAFSSALLAVLFGLAAGNMMRGVPLDDQGNFSMAFFTDFSVRGNVGLIDWYTLSVATLTVVVLAAHGATYLTLETSGPVRDRSARWARSLWAAAVPMFLIISVESYAVRPNLPERALHNPIVWLGLVALGLATVVLASGLVTRRTARAFVGSNGLIAATLATGGAAMYPVMLHSTTAPASSLSAFAVAADHTSLMLASIWWPLGCALAITSFVFISRRYAGQEAAMTTRRPRVVIVGGGFGGLAAARALQHAPVEVILLDRTNHHLFQPLLYQVATAVLTPGQIGSPIRGILRRQMNTTVALGEVTAVNTEQCSVVASFTNRRDSVISYDYLIVATGARHSYFGHDEYEQFAPGLKSLADAVAIRSKILQVFEQAEAEEDPGRHRDLLTFVLVGAGPTGVEMAGALAMMARTTLRTEFRRIDPLSARIVLVDVANRVLGSFSEGLSRATKRRLERLGVELRLGRGVDCIDADGVVVGGERIAAKSVFWMAGVAPSPAGRWLAAETDRAGRVKVEPDLTVPGHPEIFVVGDTASLMQDGKPLPGVAQVAMQGGRYAGELIRRRIAGRPALPPFRYFDKGSMAMVSRGFAVLETGKIRMSGVLAWLAWAAVHLEFLATSSLRVSVFVQWVWTYLTGQRGSRLIESSGPSVSPATGMTAPRGAV